MNMNYKIVRQTNVIPDREAEYGKLKGKRLLLLGGGSMMKEVVIRAKLLGVYTLVMGLDLDTDEAKTLCDKPIYGNARDVDEVVNVCKKENVDGITTGYVDILLQTCHDACNRLGLPYYANNELIAVTTNKTLYKEVCKKYGIPVPDAYNITDINSRKQLDSIKYPVFIKPVDASGSRGAAICNNESELIENFNKALKWSPSKTISVEEYLTGQDIILDYLICDGKAHLVSMFDRMVTPDRKPPINSPNIQFAPSVAVDSFMKDVDESVQAFCDGLGIKDGIIFFQGYYKDGKIKLFEMGCRLGASFFNIEEAFIGVNPVDVLIHYALTGKMTETGNFDLITPKYKGIGCALYMMLKLGVSKVGQMIGIDAVSDIPYVEHVNAHLHPGESVSWERVADVRILTIYIAAPDSEALKRTVKLIYDMVKITDEQGESILAPVYSIENF